MSEDNKDKDKDKEWKNLDDRIREAKEHKRVDDAQLEFERVNNSIHAADNRNGNDNGNGKDTRSVADKLVDLISQDSTTFFKGEYDTAHAQIHNADHFETVRVEGSKFKRHLIRLYHESENKVPTAEAVTNAIQVLQAQAEYRGETFPIAI